jgi:hypothetical protein
MGKEKSQAMMLAFQSAAVRMSIVNLLDTEQSDGKGD